MALHIMDIVQNSIKAKASEISVDINVNEFHQTTTVEIEDNGVGMDAIFLKKVIDPYTTSRTTRNVGLGIPLLKMNSEITGGSFIIESQPNQGTKTQAIFYNNHIDCIPLGDIPGVIMLLIGANPLINLKYKFQTPDGAFNLDTREIKETIEDIPINNPDVLHFIKEMIQENMDKIYIKY
ncbi:ATP-binding protein [Flavobacterium sp.]|uniref:ATP-binding protein n=1 Tax=Flavobacterium sp. TaxID=239 RepID=UPI0037C0ECE2